MANVKDIAARVRASTIKRLDISNSSTACSREMLRRSELAVLESRMRLQPVSLALPASPDEGAAMHPACTATPAPNSLELVKDKDFQNETVELDGKHFINCDFSDCVLVYRGQPLLLETTHFTGCRFRFEDEAALTLRFCECFELGASSADAYTIGPAKTTHGRPN